MTEAMKLDALRDGADASLVSVSIAEMVEAYISEQPGQRLLLPTIQRSLVWRNDQIINYWDTLLRGWFPGLMLVHGVRSSEEHSYTSAGELLIGQTGDLELFDGQQRMAAILLGFGEGPLAKTHRLWIELSETASDAGEMPYRLRITSIGQPFGYQPSNPNSKLDLDTRRKRWDAWFDVGVTADGTYDVTHLQKRLADLLGTGISLDPAVQPNPTELAASLRELAFDLSIDGPKGIGAAQVFPLAPIARDALSGVFNKRQISPGRKYAEGVVEAISEIYRQQSVEAVERFDRIRNTPGSANLLSTAIQRFSRLEIAVKKIGAEVLSTPETYQEFFKRIGQGGTALSEDELSYSLIKSAFPQARVTVEHIARDKKIGRLGSPTEIALAGLRLARIEAVKDTQAWQRVSKPNATWTQKLIANKSSSYDERHDLNPNQQKAVKENFEAMISPLGEDVPPRLHQIMSDIRRLIANDATNTPTGFPKILLGRLPAGFIDLAVVFAGHAQLTPIDADLKRSLLLWSLTLGEPEPFTRLVAEQVDELADAANHHAGWFAAIIRRLEADGKALTLPSDAELDAAEAWSEHTLQEHPGGRVFGWEERFQPANSEGRQISRTLNEMNFWSSKGKSALLWLQRTNIDVSFAHFDPTSDRDDDLPVDLDHIVSQDVFNFTWNDRGFPVLDDGSKLDATMAKQLREFRNGLGNTLGNLRWLSSSENRRRGSGRGQVLVKSEADFVSMTQEELEAFNRLLEPLDAMSKGMANWKVQDLMKWQQLVLTRTVRQVRRLLNDSQMNRLAPEV